MEFFQKIEWQVAILVALFGVIGFAFKHYFARAQKQSLHFQEPPPPENALVHQENTLKRIGEICFDYLPISPLERGWKWDYVDTNRKPFFSLAKISPVPGCLKVETEKPYCIKYQIEDEIFQNCKRVKVCIKLRAEEDTMFWTQVEVSTKDNSKWNKVWIKYYKGNKPSEKYE